MGSQLLTSWPSWPSFYFSGSTTSLFSTRGLGIVEVSVDHDVLVGWSDGQPRVWWQVFTMAWRVKNTVQNDQACEEGLRHLLKGTWCKIYLKRSKTFIL